jgi:ubiquitin-conjugating enzyme E2 D/E
MALLRCLTKQLKEMENDPPPLCEARPVDSSKDMFNWIGSIRGPEGSPFQAGIFYLTIHFPTDFPFKPPRIRFTTRVYHPNISPQGDICLDTLHDKWSPALSIRTILLSICSLLTDPNPEHGLDNEILNVYRTNKTKYEENARDWTKKYAMGNEEI